MDIDVLRKYSQKHIRKYSPKYYQTHKTKKEIAAEKFPDKETRKNKMLELRDSGVTAAEIARIYGLSRERIRQIIGNGRPPPKYKPQKIKQTVELRVFKRINIRGLDDCWEYQGSKTFGGYGHLHGGRKHNQYAHRIAYRIFFGEYDESLCVLHKCDNPGCCNPYHLFLGTQIENVNDRDKKNRTSKNFTKAQVLSIWEDYNNGMNISNIAKKYGVVWLCISNLIKGKTKAYNSMLDKNDLMRENIPN